MPICHFHTAAAAAAGGGRRAAGGRRQAMGGSHSPGVGGLAVDAEAARARGHEKDKPGRAGHVEGVDVDRALHAVGAAVEPAVAVLLVREEVLEQVEGARELVRARARAWIRARARARAWICARARIGMRIRRFSVRVGLGLRASGG